MKLRILPAFMFLVSLMAMAPCCLGGRASQSGIAESGQSPVQPLHKNKLTALADKHAASAGAKTRPPDQPIKSNPVPTALEAATEQFNSEARAIEQNPEKLAAMQKELNEEAEQSATKLSDDQNSAVRNESAASPKYDLWNSLGVSLGEPDQSGVPVQDVRPNSPAALAGLRTGDVITKLDGTRVHSPADLRGPLADNDSKKQIHLQARRRGIELTLSIQTDLTQPAKPAQGEGGSPLSR